MSKSEPLFGEYWRENLGTHFLLLMVAIIWGSTWAAGRFLSFGQEDSPASLEPATAAWLRYVFAVVVFFMWAISNKKRQGVRFFPPDRVSWKFTIWMGLLGTMGYQLLFMNGMLWTAAGDASLIIPLNPVFTVLLAYPMLGQRVTKKMAIGLIIGLSGVVIVVGWSPNSQIPFEHRAIGDGMIILAALMWAATSNLTKILMSLDRGYSALEIVIWYSFVGWLMLTPWMIFEIWGSPLPEPTRMEWATIAYLGVLSTVISYVWFARGIEIVGPTAASSYVFLVPVFGVLSGWSLLGEEVGASMAIGFLLIVMGVREVQRESDRVAG